MNISRRSNDHVEDYGYSGPDKFYLITHNFMTELITHTQPNILSILTDIIRRKQLHTQEGVAIKKLEAIYASELKAAQDQIHRMGTWGIIMIHDMEDSHLLNTIKLYLRQNRGEYRAIPTQYIEEAKRRDGIIEQIIAYEPVIEQEDNAEDWVF
jgi:hypothetical protein